MTIALTIATLVAVVVVLRLIVRSRTKQPAARTADSQTSHRIEASRAQDDGGVINAAILGTVMFAGTAHADESNDADNSNDSGGDSTGDSTSGFDTGGGVSSGGFETGGDI